MSSLGLRLTPQTLLLAAGLLINGVAFLLMAWDKHAAGARKPRTPERRLLLLALSGGALGIFFGMHVFRHKTRHLRFRLGVPAILLLYGAVYWVYSQWGSG